MNIGIIVLLLLAQLPFPGPNSPYSHAAVKSDTFPGSSLSSNWTVVTGAFSVASNTVYGNNSGANSLAYWNAYDPGADQYSQATLTSVGAGSPQGPAVRIQTGSTSGYYCKCTSASCQLYRMDSGTESFLGTSAPNAAGDVIKLNITGSSLTCYKNGSSIITATDSTYSTGKPGIFANGNTSVNPMGTWSTGP